MSASHCFLFLILPKITVSDCFYDAVSDTYCSDHGKCNNETQQCNCEIDYGSIDCSQQYTLYQLPQAIGISLLILSIIILLLCIILMIRVYYNRKLTEIRAMSILFTQLTLIGCILVCIGTIILSTGYNDLKCVLLEWTHFCGISMVIACPLLKAYRIAAIFGNKQESPQPVHDKVLIKKLCIIMGVLLILLIAYTICNHIEGQSYLQYDQDSLYKERRCNNEFSTMISYYLLASYPMILVMVLIHYARQTRSAAKVFRDTRCNCMSKYWINYIFSIKCIGDGITELFAAGCNAWIWIVVYYCDGSLFIVLSKINDDIWLWQI